MRVIENKQLIQLKMFVTCLTIALYLICFYYFSLHHNRWFDETQAWLIAQSNSISSLWAALSFEGHPFLWYAIIYIPSKFFSISILSVIATIIYALSCSYIFFKSPFPLIFKIILPLNYYFFYQYGVVARSYSVFILLAILAADSFNTRFSSAKFLLYVALMSSVSFHSAIASIGILIAFFVELLVMCLSTKKLSRAIAKNILLFIFAVIFIAINIISILPPHDQYFLAHIKKNSVDFRRFYLAITEGVIGNNFFWTNNFIDDSPVWFQIKEFFVVIISLLFYSNFIRLAFFWPTFLYVAIPTVGILLGLIFFYANIYHFGLVFPVFLFSSWIICSSKKRANIDLYSGFFFFVFAAVGVFWTFKGITFEQNNTYSGLKNAAEYITKYDIKPITTDSVNALGVNAYAGRNVFENVHTKPYFVWSKNGNIDKSKNTARFILTNVFEEKDKQYYRLVKIFSGKIHSKGLAVSSDDTFYLYELKKH